MKMNYSKLTHALKVIESGVAEDVSNYESAMLLITVATTKTGSVVISYCDTVGGTYKTYDTISYENATAGTVELTYDLNVRSLGKYVKFTATDATLVALGLGDKIYNDKV